jgi:hypothetical protein
MVYGKEYVELIQAWNKGMLTEKEYAKQLKRIKRNNP